MASRKGFSREIIGLASAVAALVCGLWFYGSAGAFLMPYVSSAQVAHFAGFVLVFVGVLMLGGIVGFMASRLLRTAGLSWFDRALGAVFGLARGVLVSVALITAMMAFTPVTRGGGPPEAVVQSRMAPYVLEASRVFAAIAPRELKDGFHRRYEQVKSAWGMAVRGENPKREI
ncbi:MAG: CvpA family protein [Acidobacteriota bacterium]|nr:CvpA family protein [Acidobacteriota bacterium]